MAYNVYVETEQGKSIATFPESYSRRIVDSLRKIKRESGIKPEPCSCHLEEIYRLDKDVAIPLLLKVIEYEIQGLKEYLKEPKGIYNYQKGLFRRYEMDANALKSLSEDILVFRVWDTS